MHLPNPFRRAGRSILMSQNGLSEQILGSTYLKGQKKAFSHNFHIGVCRKNENRLSFFETVFVIRCKKAR